jgi:7-cyano-7-deazaguanine synthase in queuosine biosynthesis
MDTLLNFSGGLDSTFVLWHHLTQRPESRLLVHNCILKTHQGRWEFEQEAVRAVLEWVDTNTPANYHFIQTTLDLTQTGSRPVDDVSIGFLTGVILLNPEFEGIRYAYSNAPKDEIQRLSRQRLNYEARHGRVKKLRQMMWGSRGVAPRDLTVLKPLASLSKTEIWERCPADLRVLTWSCREPQGGVVCGRCHTCKQLLGSSA